MTMVVLFLVLLVFVAIGALALFTALVASLVESIVPPLGRVMTIDGATIRYVDEGSGPTIVLLHGLAGNMRHFTYALTGRLRINHRVIALDRPGCGYSVMAPGADASLRSQAAVLVQFMDALGLERPLVMGHSLGGAVALAIAVYHRDKVGGLALVAPLSHPRRDAPAPFRILVTSSPLWRWLTSWTFAAPFNIAIGSMALKYVFGPDPAPTDFGWRGGGFLNLRPSVHRGASAELMAAGENLAEMVAAYPTLDLPVGILFGTCDRVLDYTIQGVPLAETIPGATIDLVHAGGHMAPIVAPDRTAIFIQAVAARMEARRARAEAIRQVS